MSYSAHRDSIRSGDLLAWGHDAHYTWHDWKIQIVRAFTRSEYSHVGVAWVIADRVLVIEAVQPVVRVFPLSLLLPCYWYEGEIRTAWTPRVEEIALGTLGYPYSEWEAIKAFFGKVKPGENRVWQCAELAHAIRDMLGVIAGNVLTPSALVRAAKERGCTERMLTDVR